MKRSATVEYDVASTSNSKSPSDEHILGCSPHFALTINDDDNDGNDGGDNCTRGNERGTDAVIADGATDQPKSDDEFPVFEIDEQQIARLPLVILAFEIHVLSLTWLSRTTAATVASP